MQESQTTQTGADSSTIQGAANAIGGLLDALDRKPPKTAQANGAQNDTRANDVKDVENSAPLESNDQDHDDTATAHESDVSTDDQDNESTGNDVDNVENVEGDSQPPDANTELPEALDQLATKLGVEPDKLMSLKVKTKIDGQEGVATLGDLVKSYQLEGHIQQKSVQLSESKKQLDTQYQEAQHVLEERFQHAHGVINLLNQTLLKDFNNVNWSELRDSDPAEFAAKRAEYADRELALQGAHHQLNGLIQQQHAERAQAYEQMKMKFLNAETDTLLAKIPEWKNKEIAKKDASELSGYLASQGFNNNEINNILDHRHVLLSRKAMLYDRLMASKPAITKKVNNLPKVMTPGTTKSKADIKAQIRSKQIGQLRKTGRVEDAASVFMNFM